MLTVPCKIEEKKEVMCPYCELLFVTFTATYAPSNIMRFLYRKYLGRQQLCIIIGVTDNVDDFSNFDGARCNMKKIDG